MPKYFFNVDDGSSIDAEGVELENLATAKCEAVKLAGQLICDAASTFWDAQELNLTVADEGGLTLFSLHFIGSEAPAIRG